MRIEEKDGAFIIVDFNDLEAYKIARKIEKDGMDFYQDLMNLTDNEKTREALRLLIQEEEKHLKYFEDTLFDLRKNEWFEKEDDLLEEMDYGIFPSPSHEEEAMRFLDAPEKALGMGIVLENRAIQFYEACQQRVTDEKAKRQITKIIQTEQEHKNILRDILKEMKHK